MILFRVSRGVISWDAAARRTRTLPGVRQHVSVVPNELFRQSQPEVLEGRSSGHRTLEE